MPLYHYICGECEKDFELRHSYGEKATWEATHDRQRVLEPSTLETLPREAQYGFPYATYVVIVYVVRDSQ